jgi:hypothetical protein
MRHQNDRGGRPCAAGPTMPITDVSLLALVNQPMSLAPLIMATVPDLYDAFRRATAEPPGLHVTLYEFLVERGHARLQQALDWCEQSGTELVAQLAPLGTPRIAATTLVRSRHGAALLLSASPLEDWLAAVDAAASRVTEPLFTHRPGRPRRLHLALARTSELGLGKGTLQHYPVDTIIDLDRFCLALATALPYGQLRWLTTGSGQAGRGS